ncbi:MAG: hypothetical protein HUJ31_14285, partial [Pseudomonadales bacterium]|nr:hypothetical protein [Pseudomonadales bacterium]
RDDEDAPVVTRVFKWQGDEGVWHFSNNPDDAEGHEVVELDGAINLLPALGSEERDQPGETPTPVVSMPGLMSVAPAQVSEMMDAVSDMEKTVNQRKRDIDEAIE